MSRSGSLMRLVPAVAAATLAAAALTGCGAGTPGTEAAKTPEASRTASEPPKSPEQICVEIVGHWAEQELNGNSGYGDYQSRGLSDSQNNMLLDIVAEAKAERTEHGERAAEEFAARETEKRCAELHENGGPTSSSSHGWAA